MLIANYLHKHCCRLTVDRKDAIFACDGVAALTDLRMSKSACGLWYAFVEHIAMQSKIFADWLHTSITAICEITDVVLL